MEGEGVFLLDGDAFVEEGDHGAEGLLRSAGFLLYEVEVVLVEIKRRKDTKNSTESFL